MITFKKITWKNFLSTGNVANTIQLDQHNSTIITGQNGHGKSTILCALTFALFGKPFRSVTKGQLVNSINGKNCLVEIEFNTNGSDYIVRRGIKPNKFEIECNGELINQDAAIKDYQKVLEQQILKLNYKTFTQVVILGAATFVPFMQLTTNQRRDVIEDILDIKVFSIMNSILKEKLVSVRDQIRTCESEIANHRVKIQGQKKLIDALEESRQTALASLTSKIEANDSLIAEERTRLKELKDKADQLKKKQDKLSKVPDAVKQATRMQSKVQHNIETCQTEVDFFNSNTTCPSCEQHIEEDHKHKLLAELDTKIAEHQAKSDEYESVIEKMQKQVDSLNKLVSQIHDVSIDMSTSSNKIQLLLDQNQEYRDEAQTATQEVGNLTDEKIKMKRYAEDAIRLVEEKSKLLDEKHLHDVAAALLKDTGIKTAIIREYLPVMNKLINKYLAAMDFFVKFELDESFSEEIKSRGRDAFSYASFSEGEKRRLDLAILFTWRQIAKMKNSVNTNLMILDEILDGSLDAGGIDYFLSIMNQFGEHTNIFVISHREVADKFDHVIKVEKRNDFSVIV